MQKESEYTRADIFNMCDHKNPQRIFHSYTDVPSYCCKDCGGVFEDDPRGREQNETLGDPEE